MLAEDAFFDCMKAQREGGDPSTCVARDHDGEEAGVEEGAGDRMEGKAVLTDGKGDGRGLRVLQITRYYELYALGVCGMR